VVPIFPKRAVPVFAQVVFLSRTRCNELHRPRDFSLAAIPHEEMYVIGRCDVVQNAQSITPAGAPQPVSPATPVMLEFEKEFLPVTAVCKVPDQSSREGTIRPGHNVVPLIAIFGLKNRD
jgi:hypothetical protein